MFITPHPIIQCCERYMNELQGAYQNNIDRRGGGIETASKKWSKFFFLLRSGVPGRLLHATAIWEIVVETKGRLAAIWEIVVGTKGRHCLKSILPQVCEK